MASQWEAQALRIQPKIGPASLQAAKKVSSSLTTTFAALLSFLDKVQLDRKIESVFFSLMKVNKQIIVHEK